MTLLVDVGVGKAVETWLASQGHDINAVRDLNPSMTDDDILALAVQEQRSAEKVLAVQRIFAAHGDDLAGNFSVFRNNRLRIRRIATR